MTRWFLYRFSPWLLFWSTLLVAVGGVFTETGLRLIWSQARHFLPDTVEVGDVSGSLLRGLRVREIQINEPGLTLSIGLVELQWQPLKLWQRQLQIDALRIYQVDIQHDPALMPERPAPAQPEPFRLPTLPHIVIAELDLAHLRYTQAGQAPQGVDRLRLRGQHQDGQLALTLSTVQVTNQPTMSAQLQLELSPEQVLLRDVSVEPEAGGALRLSGQVGWAPELVAALELRLTQWPLQLWGPELPQNLSGALQIGVSGPTEVRVRELQLDAQWRDAALTVVTAALDWDGDGVRTPRIDIRHGNNSARAQGRVSTQLDGSVEGRVRLQAPDLATLDPQWAGRVQLDLRASGRLQGPKLELDGLAEAVQVGEIEVRKAQVQGGVSLQRGIASDLKLQVTALTLAGQRIDEINLTLLGPRRQLQAGLQARSPWGGLDLALQADLRDWQQIAVQLQTLELGLDRVETWALAEPVSMRVAGTNLQLPRLCLRSGDAAACVSADRDASGLRAEANLEQYHVWRVLRLLQLDLPDLRTEGELGLQASIAQPSGGELAVRAEFRSSPISISAKQDGVPITLLELAAGQGSYQGLKGAHQAQLKIPATADNGIFADFAASAAGQIERGALQLRLDDLEILSLLHPEIVSAAGQLQVDVDLSGRLDAPLVNLDASLSNGQMRLNTPDIGLEQVKLSARGDLEQIQLSGSARSGPGQVQFSGDLQLAQTALDMRLSGAEFVVMDTDLARVRVSPELQLKLADNTLAITGVVRIPYADIRPEDLPEAGEAFVAPSVDEFIVGSEEPTRVAGLKLRSRVRIELGQKVRVEGFGLKTGITGGLDVRLQPGRDPTGSGELILVDGSYKAYGQDLTIERGRIIFSGGRLDEPGIDLRAFRKPRPEITVGIRARGPLSSPVIGLWSDPSMAQTEQLSWLILGRSSQTESSSAEDQLALQNATLALGLKGSDFLAKRMKGRLGLDELSIGSRPGEGSAQAALVLGKYLNPRLYVSYGIGLFEPINTFRLRYELSSKWTLQTESGVESGGDIVYTIER